MRPQCGNDLTEDSFLGGALCIRQPRHGYRAGLDAVLLAAAVPAGKEGQGPATVLDAGAGAGVVGLAVARRLASSQVTLVEREPALAALARENAARNGLADRVVVVEADVAAGGAGFHAAGGALAAGGFAHVLANPPYAVEGTGTRPATGLKAGSHQMPAADLDGWVRFLATAASGDGRLTLIHRAAALPQVLAALDGQFGALRVLPIHPRQGEPASRILVEGRKGSRAPLTICAGLVLHGSEGHAFRPELEAILRHGAGLAW